ncbi:hypothetical protein FOA43_001722 [Brettanomyces nanus]|uniref:Partial AB-hydrolase lipase domain-containing protein n=1 Tax=Eeniella nana TaxID=13502 RepID=A0A875S233_EENNA|nr:uncharacterized protein FOA43_001722 [Brettanomyces nanus]QPG74395.1 hypothetical protein FOA43_001722 [Brettanomyces nanus]
MAVVGFLGDIGANVTDYGNDIGSGGRSVNSIGVFRIIIQLLLLFIRIFLKLGSRLLQLGQSRLKPVEEGDFCVHTSVLPRNPDSGSCSPNEFKETLLDEVTGLSEISKHSFEDKLYENIISAIDIVDIVHFHGYKIHEHVVRTKDGYLLSIHRIMPKDCSSATNLDGRPVVYMQHGLLTNSELFVLGDTSSRCLPFRLVDLGYDVWLGNNRGNKYSRKHLVLSAEENRFWDYSMDEFALFDIPDSINHVLNVTKQSNLSYIGFSQGSAQALAALSLNPELNSKINVFIGLSPALIPRGLNNPFCSFLANSAPELLYGFFGRRAILPSVIFWQKLFGPKIFEQVVDLSLKFLFDWKSENISLTQKKVGYPHLFSPSSVKSVIHWFQIISSRRFQMFDDGGSCGSKLVYLSGAGTKANRVAPFPTKTITTPMLLIYGESDMLIDIGRTLDELSCNVEVIGIPGYEHMDTLWAKDVETTVFDKVAEKLNYYNGTIKEKYLEL